MATTVKMRLLKMFLRRTKKRKTLFVKKKMHASHCVVQGYNDWSRRRRNFLAQQSDRLGAVNVPTNFVPFVHAGRIVSCSKTFSEISQSRSLRTEESCVALNLDLYQQYGRSHLRVPAQSLKGVVASWVLTPSLMIYSASKKPITCARKWIKSYPQSQV